MNYINSLCGALLLVVLSISFATSSHAVTHRIADAEENFIRFYPIINGKTEEVDLTNYRAEINYYPDNIEKSSLKVTIGLSQNTLVAKNEQIDSQVMKDSWLNIDTYRTATLEAKDFERMRQGFYRGHGILTLVGQRQQVMFYITLNNRKKTKQLVADVTMVVDRSNFGIGGDSGAGNVKIDNSVPVHAHLVIKAVK